MQAVGMAMARRRAVFVVGTVIATAVATLGHPGVLRASDAGVTAGSSGSSATTHGPRAGVADKSGQGAKGGGGKGGDRPKGGDSPRLGEAPKTLERVHPGETTRTVDETKGRAGHHDGEPDRTNGRASEVKRARKPPASSNAAALPISARPAKTGGAAQTSAPTSPRPTAGSAHRAVVDASESVAPSADEPPELEALRAVDRELFPPPSSRSSLGPEALDLPFALPAPDAARATWPTGLPPHLAGMLRSRDDAAPPDLGWLGALSTPDLPVRWDARVVRYLQYYRDDPRGRSFLASSLRKSGRYGAMIRRILRGEHVPEDLLWVSLVESGFDPVIRSPAGAAGLWQFMPEGARFYGLVVNRWIDERLDPERSAEAASRLLSDLHRRFGSWELALAAYNMGYVGLLAAIHKYNTNDFWELSTLESGLPWETTLYVPKIVALAVVGRNPAPFGLDTVTPDPPIVYDEIELPGGVSLRAVASAAGVDLAEIKALNPQLRAGRTPPPGGRRTPGDRHWAVRVPPGRGQDVSEKLGKLGLAEQGLAPYVTRFGETLDAVAASHRVARSRLIEINGIGADEIIRPGTVLLIPRAENDTTVASEVEVGEGDGAKVVIVPAQPSAIDGRERVFYRVAAGDRLSEIAGALRTSIDDLTRWNRIEPTARLHEGMTLQAFVTPDDDLSNVAFLREKDVHLLVVGSSEFFDYFEALRGRKRVTIVVGEKDTWSRIAKRYHLTLGQLERINHRARSEKLTAGERIVVYGQSNQRIAPTVLAANADDSGPRTLGPAVAPDPTDLPARP